MGLKTLKISSAAIQAPHYSEKGFDTLVHDHENRVFGVFDGMGVSEGSLWAAETARDTISNASASKSIWSYEQLCDLLNAINHEIKEYADQGGTTATVVYVDKTGVLHYAHVGDSRLYVLHDNRLKQVTADEGQGNILFNYLGRHGKGCAQVGAVEEWDKFMLCTDGITGDWDSEIISDVDLEHVMVKIDSPDAICERIMFMSRKADDKTILVGVKGQRRVQS